MPVEKSRAVCLCKVCLRFLYEHVGPKPKQWCAQLHGILRKPLQCLLWFNLATCQVKFQAEASLQIAHRIFPPEACFVLPLCTLCRHGCGGSTMCWRVPVMLLQSSRLMGLHPCHGFGWQVWPRVMMFWGSVLAARTSWREPQFHTNTNQQGEPCHSGQAGADTSQSNENLRGWTASSKVRQGSLQFLDFYLENLEAFWHCHSSFFHLLCVGRRSCICLQLLWLKATLKEGAEVISSICKADTWDTVLKRGS